MTNGSNTAASGGQASSGILLSILLLHSTGLASSSSSQWGGGGGGWGRGGMRPPFDPYKELGLEQSDATQEGIRAAFLRKAREWHPDKRAGQDTAEAEEAFKRIQLAYEYLYREVPVGSDDDFDTFRKGRGRDGGGRMNSDGKKRTTGIPEWGAKEGGVFSGVVQETVRLDELEHDEDDDVLYRECRCSGRFCLPLGSPDWAVGDEDGPGERHFQCDSCSLYIRVTGISVTQE